MMRREMKKTITALLAALLFLQPPMTHMAMAEMLGEAVAEESVEAPLYGDTAVEYEDAPSDVSENDISDGEQTELMQEAPDEVPDEASDELQSTSLLLNYVYIEDVAQKDTAGCRIVASFGTAQDAVSDVRLILEDIDTGEPYAADLSDHTEEAYEFDTAPLALGRGLYRVTGLTFDNGGRAESLDITAVPGMEQVVFGVLEDPGYDEEQTVSIEEMTGEPQAAYGRMTRGAEALSVETCADEGVAEELSGVVSVETTTEPDLSGISQLVTEELVQARAEIPQTLASAEEESAAPETAGSAQETQTEEEPSAEAAKAEPVTIFLDPGHDQTHAGARANGLLEEDLNLKVAQYCSDYLKSNYTNVNVYMCRNSGACPHPGTSSGDDNRARVADAKNLGADAYIALHFNSAAASAAGAMVFYPNANYNASASGKGSALASKIMEQLAKLGLRNNGIRTENAKYEKYPDGSVGDYYTVIFEAKKAGIPGIIVEHAFLTNASDAAFLKSEENLKKLGYADAIGIANAYGLSTEEIDYTASSLTVSNIDGANGSFDITLKGAKPLAYISAVRFKVYPTEDSANAYLYDAEADKSTKGKYTVTGGLENHGGVTGKYKVIAYVYDAMDRKAQVGSTTFTIEEASADSSGVKLNVKKTSDEKKVTMTLVGNGNAAEVTYQVYPTELGTKAKKTYAAVKSGSNWKASFYVKDFKASGDYKVIVYSKDHYGRKKKLKTEIFEITPASVKNVKIKSLNFDKGTFQLRANGVSAKSGVKKVQFTVRCQTGKKVEKTYAAIKRGSFYYANVDLKDFGYQLGDYLFSVTVDDAREISEQVFSETQTIEMPDMEIGAKLKSKETKLVMSAKNVGIGASVKGVRFTVWQPGKFKKKNFEAKYQSGAYNCTVAVSDLGGAGTYKMQTYTLGVNGKYIKAGKVVKFQVSDIENGVVTTKVKNEKASYLYVDSISANSAVSKVEVRAWPVSKASAKYTYIAKQLSATKYRAQIEQKKHKGIGGKYKYEVTVTLKNGVSKKLLTGKFEMGKSSGISDDGDEPFETADGLHTITGPNGVTVEQMMTYYNTYTTYPSYYKNSGSDAPTLKKFCTIYLEECEAEHIRAEVAFIQAMKETNFLRYTGDVDIDQYNFAGIGATGGGEKGNSFSSVRLGIRAQIQHLKAYANSEPLSQACVDPRFPYVTRGCAPYVEWLGIPDNPYGKGWATAQNYGSSILRMIGVMTGY